MTKQWKIVYTFKSAPSDYRVFYAEGEDIAQVIDDFRARCQDVKERNYDDVRIVSVSSAGMHVII